MQQRGVGFARDLASIPVAEDQCLVEPGQQVRISDGNLSSKLDNRINSSSSKHDDSINSSSSKHDDRSNISSSSNTVYHYSYDSC